MLGLLAAPAAAAVRLTTKPWHAFWLSAAMAAGAIWFGVTLAYLVPRAPASFTIMSCAGATYLAAALLTTRGRSSHPQFCRAVNSMRPPQPRRRPTANQQAVVDILHRSSHLRSAQELMSNFARSGPLSTTSTSL